MTVNSIKNKAIKSAIWSLLDKVVNQIGNFLLLIYLSQILSPSDFGLIAMLAIFLAVSQSIIDSGFSQALIQRSKDVTEKDLSTIFYLNLVMSLVLYFILYLSSPSISSFYNQPELTALSRVLFIIVIINSFAIVPRAVLTIDLDFKSQSITNTIATITGAIIAVYMVLNDFGYWSLVGLNLAKSVTTAVIINYIVKWRPKLLFSIRSLKSLFSFGSFLLIAGLVATTVQNLYTVLLGRYFSSQEVGYFQQGYSYTNILSTTITSVVQGVTYPIMTSMKDEEQRLISVYTKVMSIAMLVTFPIFFGFISVAEEFVLLFLGTKWLPIVPILIILSLARMITPISSLNLNILNAKGRSDLFLRVDLSKIPMTIIALVFAIPYGIMGVAIAQVFTVFISFFINAYYPGKLFGFGWLQQVKLMSPILFSSIAMYMILSVIHFDDLLIQLVVKIIVGFSSYITLCYLTKVSSFYYIVDIVKSNLSFQRK
ncbi:lipopolysaccharide biosynthesis protein [Vibrio breoganii]